MRRVTVGVSSVLDLRLLTDAQAVTATISPAGGATSDPIVAEQAPVGVGGARRWLVTFDGSEVTGPGPATVAWDVDGTSRTQQVSVVGAPHVDLPAAVHEAPGDAWLGDIAEAIDDVADQVTAYTGVVWVPTVAEVREATDLSGLLRLPPPVREIRAAADTDGNPVDVTRWDITAGDIGIVWVPTGRFAGTVFVEAGHDEPPTDLSRAMREAVRHAVKAGGTTDLRGRANLGEDGGAFPWSSASPQHARLFGIDGVDSVINLHQRKAVA